MNDDQVLLFNVLCGARYGLPIERIAELYSSNDDSVQDSLAALTAREELELIANYVTASSKAYGLINLDSKMATARNMIGDDEVGKSTFERLVDEYQDLKSKHIKLNRYLIKHESDLKGRKRDLMVEQSNYMAGYLKVLETRINEYEQDNS